MAETVRSGIESLRADVGGAHQILNLRLAELEANLGSSPEKHTIREADLPRAVQSKIVVLDPENYDGHQYGPASPLVEK